NHVVYWGFYSFAVGWPVFCLWLLLTVGQTSRPMRVTDGLLLFVTALLLYLSHALWFAAGMAWLALSSVVFRVPRRTTGFRAVSPAPVVIGIAVWYPQLAASGFVSPTKWSALPTARLSFAWLVDATFGGLTGPTEWVLLATLAAWITLALWQHRRSPHTAVDRPLLLAAGMLAVMTLLLPDLYMTTIDFAGRWLPGALILVMLAVPAPVMDQRLLCGAALAVVAGLCLATAAAWSRFENAEMTGLHDALAA